MASLLCAAVIWVLVLFMVTDSHGRQREKRALRFLVIAATALTVMGVWLFDSAQLSGVSFRDWALLGLLLLYFFHLRLKSVLASKQSELLGYNVSLVEVRVGAIPDQALVRRYKLVRALVWVYALALLVVYFASEAGR